MQNKSDMLVKLSGLLILLLGSVIALGFRYRINANTLLSIFRQQPLCKNCNVILVSIDTLSANHLPCYGYGRNTSPNLCAFAERNVLFRNTYSNAVWTLPGHASIFTGLYPSRHGVINYPDNLSRKISALPETLQSAGYETIFVMPNNDRALPIDKVYNRGIDKLYNSRGTPESPWLPALRDLEANIASRKKTFLFLHSYRVHAPYLIEDEPKLYTTDFVPDLPLKKSQLDESSASYYEYLVKKLTEKISNREDPNFEKDYRAVISLIKKYKADPEQLKKALQSYNFEWDYGFEFNYLSRLDINNPRHIEYIKALYDQTINILDASQIAELLTFFDKKEIRDSTVLIITADHGEEFMEHGSITHETIYDSNLSIPLILYIPGLKTPKEVTTPVQSVDIAPTILDILGIPPLPEYQGESLIPLTLGKSFDERLLVSDGYKNETRALRKNNWKLLLFRQTDGSYLPYELYDTNTDPNERINILFSHSDVAQRMLTEYRLTLSQEIAK